MNYLPSEFAKLSHLFCKCLFFVLNWAAANVDADKKSEQEKINKIYTRRRISKKVKFPKI